VVYRDAPYLRFVPFPYPQRGPTTHALPVVKEMDSKGYDLLSAVQVSADGCQFFTQLAYFYRLKRDCGCRRV
jgi:hypothetical protein